MTQTTRPSMFSQVVAHPTGKNGYEELVMAADLLQTGDSAATTRGLASSRNATTRWTPLIYRFTPSSKASPTLQGAALITEKFGRVR